MLRVALSLQAARLILFSETSQTSQPVYRLSPRRSEETLMCVCVCAHLGNKQHHQGDVGREDDSKGGEGKGGVLLRGQNHRHRSRDEAQDLQDTHTQFVVCVKNTPSVCYSCVHVSVQSSLQKDEHTHP